jgi:hypothetical protein
MCCVCIWGLVLGAVYVRARSSPLQAPTSLGGSAGSGERVASFVRYIADLERRGGGRVSNEGGDVM